MLKVHFLTLLFLILQLHPSKGISQEDLEALTVDAPNGLLHVAFLLNAEGRPTFEATYRDVQIANGTLGLEFAKTGRLDKNFKLIGINRRSRDETYDIPVGKASSARDHQNELVVSLEENELPHRRLDLAIRVFDDGFAIRYLLPQQEALADFVLTEELTHLSFPGDPTAHALPVNSYTTPYEKYYEVLPLSEVGSEMVIGMPLLLERSLSGSTPILACRD